MRSGLTDLQARTLRFLAAARGMVEAPDREIAAEVYRLIQTPYACIVVTEEGRRALAEYDTPRTDRATRARIARGMASAGRSALAEEDGRADR